jgi:hypothetical protein
MKLIDANFRLISSTIAQADLLLVLSLAMFLLHHLRNDISTIQKQISISFFFTFFFLLHWSHCIATGGDQLWSNDIGGGAFTGKIGTDANDVVVVVVIDIGSVVIGRRNATPLLTGRSNATRVKIDCIVSSSRPP